jgi:hypothetical protein
MLAVDGKVDVCDEAGRAVACAYPGVVVGHIVNVNKVVVGCHGQKLKDKKKRRRRRKEN